MGFNSLEFLNNYDLKYNKIAFAMIIDKNFISKVAKQKYILLVLECLRIKILMKR